MRTKRRRVSLEGPTILRGRAHKSGIVALEAPDTSDFTLVVQLPCKVSVCVLVGIIPGVAEGKRPDEIMGDEKPPDEGIFKYGFFLDLRDGRLFGQDGTNREPSALPLADGLPVGTRLRMRYCRAPAPALLASVGTSAFTALQFRSAIPEGDYVPCVLLDERSSVEVSVSRSHGRRIPDVHDAASALTRMWQERSFTDAAVACGDLVFPVHRAVLSSASPVFAAAFGGQMKEAAAARLEVPADDTRGEAVEAMLRYVYTGDLDPRVASEVLRLAHRYQLNGLVVRCGEEMLGALSPDNAADVVRALRVLREDEVVRPIWDEVVEEVRNNRELLSAALGSL